MTRESWEAAGWQFAGLERWIKENRMKIVYEKIKQPEQNEYSTPVELNKKTMEEHRLKVLRKMEEKGLDALVIYGDREHGANFAYLTGFEPRFEEALLVLHRNGDCCFLLGNENLKMSQYSFVKGRTIHVPHFSLPYQPMDTEKTLVQLIWESGLRDGMHIGCVGWKRFTGKLEDNSRLLDLPAFIADAVREVNHTGITQNASGIFLDAKEGVRIERNANELAHYEFGAGLASSRVLAALDAVEPGKTETEIAGYLVAQGQPLTVTTICATGERFTNGVVFPRAKKIAMGDRFSITLGLRGGLTSRAAYAAYSREELPQGEQDYLEQVALPYYTALVSWLEMMEIGVTGGEVYKKIEEILPKSRFHWELNPGHYTDSEEWSASPFYPDSQVTLKSGMMFQLDIIPRVPGYGGAGAEDGIAIADEALRRKLGEQYPNTWQRIQRRRDYITKVLGICLKEEILPMSDALGYFRPLLLNKEYAFAKRE